MLPAVIQGRVESMKRIAVLLLVSMLSASCMAQQHPGAEAFAERAAAELGVDAGEVMSLLEDARFKKSIVDAMTRPAEAKPWYEYRPIFLTDKRIAGGVEFWREHRELVEQAATRYGVDPEYIVAIIGVETFYGRITGSYRVLDALATLSFYYPDTGNDRSDFFSRELMQFIALGGEENLPLREVEGSYAGAMGLGQFMPSSYREYAVDLDGDGRRDLWSSLADVIGSVANYLHRHGWEPGQPVTSRAVVAADADMDRVSRRNLKPEKTLADLAQAGFRPVDEQPADLPAAVTRLREEAGQTYWLTYKNFYVITRYNRSPLYAMAVHDLARAIDAEYGE
jgi:membrane-bound lytic murein transglycosylase B